MKPKLFEDRERALEYEFFHEVDRKLLAKLREKMAFECEVEDLQKATGIADQDVLQELVNLGMTSESIIAMSLYPLVYTAWADGDVDSRESSAILAAAESVCGGRDTAAYHLLEAWLAEQPCEKIFAGWQQFVQAVTRSLTSESCETFRRDLLTRARAVASTAGGLLGIGRVSASEERALTELADALDSGANE